jgi:D-tyrosyl-tRNA(Tyr) deacylase
VRVVVQRVLRATVSVVDDAAIAPVSIERGLCIFAGFRVGDDGAVIDWMAEKCLGLRIFRNDTGALDRAVADCGGAVLAVPNFTLYGDAGRGRRPSFTAAAPPAVAAAGFERFVAGLRRGTVPVASGFFRTQMHVELVNDGPVTLWIER